MPLEDMNRQRLDRLEPTVGQVVRDVADLKRDVAVLKVEQEHISKQVDNERTERSKRVQTWAGIVTIAGGILAFLAMLARAGWPSP